MKSSLFIYAIHIISKQLHNDIIYILIYISLFRRPASNLFRYSAPSLCCCWCSLPLPPPLPMASSFSAPSPLAPYSPSAPPSLAPPSSLDPPWAYSSLALPWCVDPLAPPQASEPWTPPRLPLGSTLPQLYLDPSSFKLRWAPSSLRFHLFAPRSLSSTVTHHPFNSVGLIRPSDSAFCSHHPGKKRRKRKVNKESV